MYLIFDASCNGKPKNWKADVSDIFNWPRLIHLSWIVLDKELQPIKDFDCIAKPNGFKISEANLESCKLDQEDIDKKSEDLKDILANFTKDVEEAKYIFTHNENFNVNVVGAEYIRSSMKNTIAYANTFCLMREATWFCKLKGKGKGYKWPSLNELYMICFQQKYTPLNNARADTIAATRCFKKLMMLGELEDCFED